MLWFEVSMLAVLILAVLGNARDKETEAQRGEILSPRHTGCWYCSQTDSRAVWQPNSFPWPGTGGTGHLASWSFAPWVSLSPRTTAKVHI